MPGLTEGRIVHYVDDGGNHAAAVITDLIRRDEGRVYLYIFPSMLAEGQVVGASYSEESVPGTWHWVEPA